MNCPQCSGVNTQKIQMIVMGGTTTSSSFGGGVSLDGDVGIGIIDSKSTTVLAQSLMPGTAPSEPIGYAGPFLLFLAAIFFNISIVTLIMGVEDFSKGYNVGLIFIFVSCVIFIGVCKLLFMAKRQFKNAKTNPVELNEWNRKKNLFDSGWFCHHCGHQWLP